MSEKYLIPRIKKFKIWFEGIEPCYKIVYMTSPRSTVHYERGLFMPIHNLVHKWKLRKQLWQFKKLGVKPEKCEGCDDGWATWMIDEPNGENYSITCCDDCVNFYDWKFSRRRLKPEHFASAQENEVKK